MTEKAEGNGVRGSTQLERTIQHVLQAVLTIAILGTFAVLSDLRTVTAVTNVEVMALKVHLDTFRAMAGDRYTGAQAARDLATMSAINDDQEKRLRALERSGSDIRSSP